MVMVDEIGPVGRSMDGADSLSESRDEHVVREPSLRSSELSSTREVLHELGQPLSAIRCFGEVALSRIKTASPDYSALRSTLEQMINASDLAAGIIERFRDHHDQQQRRRQSCDVDLIVQNSISLLSHPIEKKRVRVSKSNGPALAFVDPVQIQEVLINLLRNAIEAIPPDTGIVRIDVTVHDEWVLVGVTDNGSGLQPELAMRLFEPIQSGKVQGMGLGLAVSRSIVESHGGRIWYSANRPTGAKFQFSLPATSHVGRRD